MMQAVKVTEEYLKKIFPSYPIDKDLYEPLIGRYLIQIDSLTRRAMAAETFLDMYEFVGEEKLNTLVDIRVREGWE